MTVRKKLEEFDLFDNGIIRHGNLDYIRDYEIIAYLGGESVSCEVRYLFKGCIEVYFKNTVDPINFSMDKRLLNLERQDESDYPQAFVWAVGADAYAGWKLEENTDELDKFEGLYKIKFYKFILETNAYELSITFHDLEIEQLKSFENQVLKK